MGDQRDIGMPTLARAGDTCDWSDFRRDASAHLDHLARTGGVEILTVGGQAKGVVMAPHGLDQMAEQIERIGITAAFGRGIAESDAGRVRPAEQAGRDITSKIGWDMNVVEGG